jgi:hypothetical protein
MDTVAVTDAVRRFIVSHRTQLAYVPTIQSQLLELAAFVSAVEHYRLAGYAVTPVNLIRNRFKMKRTSAGYPWRFSWFRATNGLVAYDIHANLPVGGAYRADGARYVVDVAISPAGRVPSAPPRRGEWAALKNRELVTFVEAKRLTIYPMLLAQFLGIVHEIKPSFIRNSRRPPGFVQHGHFPPTLVTTGPWAKSCERIYAAYPARGFRVVVVPNLDVVLSTLRSGRQRSPLTP